MHNLSYEKGIAKGKEIGIKLGVEMGKELGKQTLLCQIIESKIRSNASDETIYNEFKEFGASMKIIKIIRNRMSHTL